MLLLGFGKFLAFVVVSARTQNLHVYNASTQGFHLQYITEDAYIHLHPHVLNMWEGC